MQENRKEIAKLGMVGMSFIACVEMYGLQNGGVCVMASPQAVTMPVQPKVFLYKCIGN